MHGCGQGGLPHAVHPGGGLSRRPRRGTHRLHQGGGRAVDARTLTHSPAHTHTLTHTPAHTHSHTQTRAHSPSALIPPQGVMYSVTHDGNCTARACPSCAPPQGMPFSFLLIDGAGGDTTRGVATYQGKANVDGQQMDHWAHDRGTVGG